jgi:hypothetical protein
LVASVTIRTAAWLASSGLHLCALKPASISAPAATGSVCIDLNWRLQASQTPIIGGTRLTSLSFRLGMPQVSHRPDRNHSPVDFKLHHYRACSPAAQRTRKRYAGRCAEVVETGSIAAFDRRCGSFLAKEVLRFQHSKLSAVCGKASLHSSQSGEGWVVRTSGGLGVEQFSPLRNWL